MIASFLSSIVLAPIDTIDLRTVDLPYGLFVAFAALAVASALVTITRRNPVVAAVWLVLSFFSVAVCYVLMAATFLAAIQVLVYAGAMMVLFVFVIMVLDVDDSGAERHKQRSPVATVGYGFLGMIVIGFLGWVALATVSGQYLAPPAELPPGSDFGSAQALGELLFGRYLFAFEAISLLLVAAVIGAVVVARSRREREKEANLTGMSALEREVAGIGVQVEDPLASPVPVHDFGGPSATGHKGGV